MKDLSTACYRCDAVVREGSRRFATLELLQTSAYAPCTLVSPGKMLVETVRYSRTTPNSCGRTLYTLLALVVREGSRRFAALEPHRTSARAPCTPCFPGKEVVRECSVASNHAELL